MQQQQLTDKISFPIRSAILLSEELVKHKLCLQWRMFAYASLITLARRLISNSHIFLLRLRQFGSDFFPIYVSALVVLCIISPKKKNNKYIKIIIIKKTSLSLEFEVLLRFLKIIFQVPLNLAGMGEVVHTYLHVGAS